MIEYDYLLERDEGDRVVPYVPVYSRKLHNLMSLVGENATGKSTLLHLIALGCHGLKAGVVNDALREKIRALVQSDHQKLQFDISITTRSGDLALQMQKSMDSPDVTIRDGDGKALPWQQFNRRFKLIYDIPEDPVSRLPKLLEEVKDKQEQLGELLRRLRGSCMDLLGEIEDARNPEKIAEREEEISRAKKRIDGAKKKLGEQEDLLKTVRMYTSLRFYRVHSERVAELKSQVKNAEKADRKVIKDRKDRDSEYDQLLESIRVGRERMDDLYRAVSPVLDLLYSKSKEKNRLAVWRDIDVRLEVKMPDVRQDLKEQGTHFLSLLRSEQATIENSSGFEEARLLRDLVALLKPHEDSATEIPGAGLSVRSFIAAIQAELEKHDALIARGEAVSEAASQLEELLEAREDVAGQVERSRGLAAESGRGDGDGAASPLYDVDKLKSELDQAEARLEHHRQELMKLGIKGEADIRTLYPTILTKAYAGYENYRERDLQEKITAIEKTIADVSKSSVELAGTVRVLEDQLKDLKRSKPHQYQDKADRLRRLIDRLQRMQQLVNQYQQYIRQLSADNSAGRPAQSVGKDPLGDAYRELVFEHLGRRMGRVRVVNEEYEVAKIDLLNRELVTTSGKRIKLLEMSTGQTQSAYLMGLLGGYDGRTMIALLDETATMDEQSLGPVRDKLKELYDADKLLVGLVVQAGNKKREIPLA